MNLRKACDTAHQNRILKKHPCFGMQNMELEWLTRHLFHQRQKVKIDGFLSDTQRITCDVPQGYKLVLLLLLLFVNDLLSAIKSCQILYADDAVLFRTHQIPEVLEQELNTDANRVAN